MATQIGSGGVIYNIYTKYENLFEHLSIHANNHLLNKDDTKPENVLYWGAQNSFQSEANNEGIFESLVIKFRRPFVLNAYRMQMSPYYRFQKSWKVETQYRDGELRLVHHSDEVICTKMLQSPSYDCGAFSEKLFILDKDKRFICDTIKITATDKDTKGTYSLTVGAIEFYERHVCIYTKICALHYSYFFISSFILIK